MPPPRHLSCAGPAPPELVRAVHTGSCSSPLSLRAGSRSQERLQRRARLVTPGVHRRQKRLLATGELRRHGGGFSALRPGGTVSAPSSRCVRRPPPPCAVVPVPAGPELPPGSLRRSGPPASALAAVGRCWSLFVWRVSADRALQGGAAAEGGDLWGLDSENQDAAVARVRGAAPRSLQNEGNTVPFLLSVN